MWIQKRTATITAGVLFTAGCAAAVSETSGPNAGNVGGVSEAVAALAAPGQDLSTARLLDADNCYWYMREGPVETTLIPLLTVDGRMICVNRPS